MLLNCGVGENCFHWTSRRSNEPILKEISPKNSLEGQMLELKLQYFCHLMQRTDSLEETLMLGKIEGRNWIGQQRIRWLDSITDSVSLSKLWKLVSIVSPPVGHEVMVSYGFCSSHVWMWELDYKESWAPKNRCFWTVLLEKNLESPLDSKEIQLINPKENQSWIFIGRTDAEAETPIL